MATKPSMANQRKLSTAISNLKSGLTEVKVRYQGAHSEMIVAVEDASKALLAENAALKQKLKQQMKTARTDAMRLAYEPDLLLRVHGRTYPALLFRLGPAVAEAVSFDESGTPTLSLGEHSHDAVCTAMQMLHFGGFVPEGTTPQQLFETLQLAVHWELPIVAPLHGLLGKALASSTPAYGTAVELLSYTEDKLGAKCSECYGKCECRKDKSLVPPPACTCSLCDKCPGTAFLKLRKACIAVVAANASALSDEVVRGLPLVDMLPAVKGISELIPALEVVPAQAEELNLVHPKIVAAIAARAREDGLAETDSDGPFDDHFDEEIAARTVDGGKSATAGCFVRIKSTTSTCSPPAIVMTSGDSEYKWARTFCAAQKEGPMWHGQGGRLLVAEKLAAGTAVVFKATVRIESLWMKYMLVMRFLRAHGRIDGVNVSPVQVLIRASAHAALGEPLLQAMRPILLEVIARNFDLCDDLCQLDGVSMAQLLTSEPLTVSSENTVKDIFLDWAAAPTRLMHEIDGVAPAVRFPLCKLWPLSESLQGVMKVSNTVRELVNEALDQQLQRTAHGPSSLTKASKRKFLLDSSNSELSEIPRTEARKRSRGSVHKLTAEQLTRPALGLFDDSDDSDGF